MMRAAIVASLLLCSGSVAAEDLQSCVGIADSSQRLACYDRIAKPAVTSAPAAPVTTSTPAPAAIAPITNPSKASADFGAETVQPTETANDGELHARLVGSLRDWKRGTVFELDNGQAWVSIDTGHRSDDTPIETPQVTVEQGLMGYWMHIDGERRGFKVRRIR